MGHRLCAAGTPMTVTVTRPGRIGVIPAGRTSGDLGPEKRGIRRVPTAPASGTGHA